jgi:hypothetical protein
MGFSSSGGSAVGARIYNNTNDRFCHGIKVFLKGCPGLKRLVVRGNVQQARGATGEGDPNSIGEFISSFTKLERKPKFSEIDIQYEHIKVFPAVPFLSLAGKMFCVWIALELISFDPWCKRNPDQPKMGYEQEMATK